MFRYLEEADAQLFFDKFLQVSESEAQVERGSRFDRESDINYPPYPSGLDIGHLLCNLSSIPECFGNEQVQEIARHHATGQIYGLLHFLRKRWGYKPKQFGNLPARHEPLGNWYLAAYKLCEQVAPYIKTKNADAGTGVNAAHWMKMCIQEIAINGGLFSLLDILYPPKEIGLKSNMPKDDAAAKRRKKMLEKEHCTKEDYRKYLNSIISRIRTPEPPITNEDKGCGYFGALLFYATQRASQDKDIQTGTMKTFTNATRAYLKAVLGDESTRLFINQSGIAGQQSSPKMPFISLTAETLDMRGLQELTAKRLFSG